MTKDKIMARLTVHDMKSLTPKEFNALKRWLKVLSDEMQTLDKKAYTNSPRWTIYRP